MINRVRALHLRIQSNWTVVVYIKTNWTVADGVTVFFLVQEYLQCSSTEILQTILVHHPKTILLSLPQARSL